MQNLREILNRVRHDSASDKLVIDIAYQQILDEIKISCLQFDYGWGAWPESKYGGLAIFNFIIEQSISCADWEKQMEERKCKT